MKYEDVKAAWNAQADQFNQLDMLCSEEIVEFAMSIEREECAKICEDLHDRWSFGEESGPRECATAIRNKA